MRPTCSHSSHISSLFRPLIILSLLCSTVFAEVKAVITGPEIGNPGDLVVLYSTDSVGDNFQWIPPDNIQTLVCSGTLAFASGTPGTYNFILVAADKEANIAHTTHTVVIGKPLPPVPPPTPPPTDPPVPPTPPVPVPATDFQKISKDSAPNDSTTAAKIIENINLTKSYITSNNLSLTESRDLYKSNIGIALALRPRGSQSDWTIWRTKLEAEFLTANITDKDILIAAYDQIAKGL